MLATMPGPAGSVDKANTADMYTLITILSGHQASLLKLYCPVSDKRVDKQRTNSQATAGSATSGSTFVDSGDKEYLSRDRVKT